MSDIFKKSKRSLIMSKIHGKDTKPELIVRRYLFSKGFRYRVDDKRYPGSPDIVLPRYKTVIFVHGCFWHGHELCRKSALPSTNREFWENKIKTNMERDRKNILELEKLGWKVIVIWECEIGSRSGRELKLAEVEEEIRKNIS